MKTSYSFSIILLAGGKGQRVGFSLPKQYHLIREKPLVYHSLDVLFKEPFKQICVVCDPLFECYFSSYSDLLIASCGKTRQKSVEAGFLKLTEPVDLVLIHDSARPFISSSIIQKVLESAFVYQAAASALPASSTFKIASKDKLVQQTLDRSSLYEIQTPQALQYDLLKRGLLMADALNLDLTDDLALAELVGIEPKLVEGSKELFKVTHLEDLAFANFLVSQRSS